MEPVVIEHFNRNKYLHTVFDKPLEQVKKCRRCGSVFINKFECEACGYQFQKEWVGDPLGTNSVYSLQQQYQDNLIKQQQCFPWVVTARNPLHRAYRRRLLKRFEVLFFYLEKRDFAGEEQNKLSLFLVELKDICEAMIVANIRFDKIKRVVNCSQDTFLKESVFNWLYAVEHQRHNFSLIDFIFYYRIFGILRISFLLLFILLIALVSSLCIAFYS